MNCRFSRFKIFLPVFAFVLIAVLGFSACSVDISSSENVSQSVSPTESIENPIENTASITGSLLDLLEITLPDGMKRERISDAQESFAIGTNTVGGIFILDCDESVFDNVLDILNPLGDIVLDAMKEKVSPNLEWNMGESSVYGLYNYTMGNDQSEYVAYAVRGKSACYVVWMDRKQVNYDTEKAIMESLSSEDITEELNTISNEEYSAAVADEMAKHQWRFQITLPDGFTCKDTSENAALFYRGDQVVGGYAMTHFDKDILNNAKDHEEEIFNLMRDSVKDQIDLTDYTPELVTDQLVNVKFTNGDKECTQWLMSYGQRGIQYNIWMDTAALDEQTAMDIVWSGNLEQID